ncbi:hypothetical protein VP249E411_P0048 [Vibrio phage 249E41-1]|nr:hypothetical protein VP249E411_P0048 [Vibrio phage 249E41-1]
MEVGDTVNVFDDGKRSRVEKGKVISVLAEDVIVVEHLVWGYGDCEHQLPTKHIYRNINMRWEGWQMFNKDIDGEVMEFEYPEWAFIEEVSG